MMMCWGTTWTTCTAGSFEVVCEIQRHQIRRGFSQFGRSSTACIRPAKPDVIIWTRWSIWWRWFCQAFYLYFSFRAISVSVNAFDSFISVNSVNYVNSYNFFVNFLNFVNSFNFLIQLIIQLCEFSQRPSSPLPVGQNSSAQHSPWPPTCMEISSWKLKSTLSL